MITLSKRKRIAAHKHSVSFEYARCDGSFTLVFCFCFVFYFIIMILMHLIVSDGVNRRYYWLLIFVQISKTVPNTFQIISILLIAMPLMIFSNMMTILIKSHTNIFEWMDRWLKMCGKLKTLLIYNSPIFFSSFFSFL